MGGGRQNLRRFLKKYIDHRYAAKLIMRRARRSSQARNIKAAAEWLAAAAARPGFASADFATMRQAVALVQLGKYGEAGDILAGIFTSFPTRRDFPWC